MMRLTQKRLLILEVLKGLGGHPTALEIFMKVKEKCPKIGLSTVYRTLELLTKNGILRKFVMGDGQARYEYAKGEHHHHLICQVCGKIIDYSDFIKEETELVKKIEENLKEKYGFEIQTHTFQFYGICPDCQKRCKEE